MGANMSEELATFILSVEECILHTRLHSVLSQKAIILNLNLHNNVTEHLRIFIWDLSLTFSLSVCLSLSLSLSFFWGGGAEGWYESNTLLVVGSVFIFTCRGYKEIPTMLDP
jgi:hypothetical protein